VGNNREVSLRAGKACITFDTTSGTDDAVLSVDAMGNSVYLVFWTESEAFCPEGERVKFAKTMANFQKHLVKAKQSQSEELVGAKNRRANRKKLVLRRQGEVTKGQNEATAASTVNADTKNKGRTEARKGRREASAASNVDADTTNPTTDVKRFRVSCKSFAAGAAGSEGSVIGPGVVAQPEMSVAGGGSTLPNKKKRDE
jgi:hypothetical protein